MTTINSVGVGLSGASGTGSFVGSTGSTLVTPNLGAATATSVAFSPSTGGIIGTTTNNSASSGIVGEFISSVIVSASSVSLSNGSPLDLTNLSLSAGDWYIWGNLTYLQPGSTNISYIIGWLSLTSATLPDASLYNEVSYGAAGLVSNLNQSLIVPSQRFSLPSTTTVYISGLSGFTVSTLKFCGGIYARRPR